MISSTFAVRAVVERNLVNFRRDWHVVIAGFAEPVIWLLALGIGLGELIDDIEHDGARLEYGAFVAPALVAVSAMNGAAFDATFNFYFKLRYARIFDSMLATPLTMTDIVFGEIAWSMIRATAYALAFLVLAAALGFVASWWAVLIIPTALLLGLAIAGLGMWVTTFMRSWHDFDYVTIALQVLFLCSATFFPLSVYPAWARLLVMATPLYQGVALCRDLAVGAPDLVDLGHAAYLVAMTWACLTLARRRLTTALVA